jgi:DNA-binding SARP family transcriptional activator
MSGLTVAGMDFRILGSLEVWDGERQVELAGPKRRAVLALLLFHANEVVGVDRLVDQLWGEKAPRNAAAALHTHVSRLRKELGREVVARRAWGYVLRIEPNSLDLERFSRLSAAAESLPARERAEKLREALALWRGPPLEDLAFEPGLAGDIARLEELHLTVLENRIDADLEAGNEAGLISELEAVIAQQPLRERLRGQLILALYRSGRQAEALEVYRETRRVLSDELGLEPSPQLRELERAILQQDPALQAGPGRAAVAADTGMRPSRRRPLYIGALLAALLLAGLGTAAVMNHKQSTLQIGWGGLASVPSSMVHRFAKLGIGAASVRRDQMRVVPLPDGDTISVAPTAKGGFCQEFSYTKAIACHASRTYTINPVFGATSVSVGATTTTTTAMAVRCGAAERALLEGYVNAKPGATLWLEFSDGSHSRLPLTWVGQPISAGFFEQAAPAGKRVTALVLRQPGGAILAATQVDKNKALQTLNLYEPGPSKSRHCPKS